MNNKSIWNEQIKPTAIATESTSDIIDPTLYIERLVIGETDILELLNEIKSNQEKILRVLKVLIKD